MTATAASRMETKMEERILPVEVCFDVRDCSQNHTDRLRNDEGLELNEGIHRSSGEVDGARGKERGDLST